MKEEFNSNSKKERKITKEGLDVIDLFKRARQSTNEGEKKQLYEAFAQKLVAAVTPAGQKPHNIGEMHLYMKDIAEGTREGRFYIGAGTSGQRILFENYAVILKSEVDKISRWSKSAKVGYQDDKYIELETIDKSRRWMRYPKPSRSDWKFGGKFWEQFIETFGEETVDLLEDMEQ